MKLTINTKVLYKHGLSLGEFLLLLLAFFHEKVRNTMDSLIEKDIAGQDNTDDYNLILSNEVRNLVVRILTESNDKVINSDIDFESLARQLQELYPEGCRQGTSYPWRSETYEVAQKLRLLLSNYGFTFTPEEAVEAVKEYLSQFEKPYKGMKLLKYFILKTKNNGGHTDSTSLMVDIIENNRENNEDNN